MLRSWRHRQAPESANAMPATDPGLEEPGHVWLRVVLGGTCRSACSLVTSGCVWCLGAPAAQRAIVANREGRWARALVSVRAQLHLTSHPRLHTVKHLHVCMYVCTSAHT